MPYSDPGSYCQYIRQTLCIYCIDYRGSCIPNFLCAAKPILYAGKALTGAESAFLEDESVIDTFILTLNHACCVIVSPIGQAAQIIKAAAGIIYPGFYFKNQSTIDPYVGEGEIDEGKFVCDARAISAYPVEMLDRLAKKFLIKDYKLKIKFIGQRGDDAGGLSREFTTVLFEALCVSKEEGKKSPTLELSDKLITNLNQKNRKILDDLGVVLGGLLKHNYKHPFEALLIGAGALTPSLLKGAFAFTQEELNADFNKLSIDRKIEIWLAADNNEIQSNKVYITILQKLNSESLEKIEFTEYEEDALGGSFIPELNVNDQCVFSRDRETKELKFSNEMRRQTLEQNIEKVKDWLLEEIEQDLPKIETFYLVAKGMNKIDDGAHWIKWKAAGASKNQEVLEGILSKELVLECLQFHGFEESIEEGIKEWVSELDERQLKNLVKYMKGSVSLFGKTEILTFNAVSKSDTIAFPHTCFKRIDVYSKAFRGENRIDRPLRGDDEVVGILDFLEGEINKRDKMDPNYNRG